MVVVGSSNKDIHQKLATKFSSHYFNSRSTNENVEVNFPHRPFLFQTLNAGEIRMKLENRLGCENNVKKLFE